MEFFNKCHSLLKEVVINKQNLALVFKEKVKFKTPFERNNALSVSGSFLRSYYFIYAFVKNVFRSKDLDDVIAIGILYVGTAMKNFFTKEYAKEKLTKYFKDKGVELTSNQIEEFDKLLEQQRKYEIPNIKTGSFKFFSITYNLPTWIIKMIHTQYGRGYLIPFMKFTSRMPNQHAYKNIFEEYKDFDKDIQNKFKEISPNLYKYIPQTSIKKELLVKDYYLLPIQEAAYSLLRYLPTYEQKDITIYLGSKTFDFFLPLSKYAENYNIILLEKNEKDNNEITSKVVKYPNIKNINKYKCDEKEAITYIDKPQDLIVYYPKSSSIELVRREPEYSLLFDENTIDEIIKTQEEGLVKLSKHIKENGHLIYVVNTINIKETIVQINKFLNNNKSFKLEKEETFFPQDKLNSIYYFAILRKLK